MVRVDKIHVGSSVGSYNTIEKIIRYSDRLVSPNGRLATPVPIVNDVKPAAKQDHYRYWDIEVVLDGDNPTIFTNMDCDGSGGRILNDTDRNDGIGFFVVEGVDTEANIISYTFESGKVFLASTSGHVSNEPGVERSPVLYRFVCVGDRTEGSSSYTGSDSTTDQYVRVESVTINTESATNIMSYRWEMVGPEGGDILYPRFTPSVFDGIGVVEPSGKYWKFVITFDTSTTLFNNYIHSDAANDMIDYPVYITLTTSVGGTATHTLETSKVYVSGYQPSSLLESATYQPGAVELVCIGTRTVT
jgi:hypothetical protein